MSAVRGLPDECCPPRMITPTYGDLNVNHSLSTATFATTVDVVGAGLFQLFHPDSFIGQSTGTRTFF